MGDIDDYIQLVKHAQYGDERSLDRLAELARERLRSYIYRLTLDEDMAQDIAQESILEMLKFLDKLERADRFWPWLFRIAGNNLRDERGRERLRREASTLKMSDSAISDEQQGLDDLVSQELKQVVSAAVMSLKARHRKILILRCYEEMTYSDISEVMACSEFAARRLFYRAKKSLARQLSRRGLGRGSLLTALVIFGKMTATSEAAATSVSVTAATVDVGLLASLAAIATSRTGMLSLATGLIVSGATVIGPLGGKIGLGPQRSNAESSIRTQYLAEEGRANEECWYYYPPNSNGAVMIRRMSGTDGSEQSYCQWLHNDQANYYKQENTIYIENYRMWSDDLSVQRLPSDNSDLKEFLSRVEGKNTEMNYTPVSSRGSLVITRLDQKGAFSQSSLRYDVSNEENFRYNWQRGAKIIDHRDKMHKRGWTYFRVTGEIDGKTISGVGRIPFVLGMSKSFSPWLELQFSDGSRIVDNDRQACLYDSTGKAIARYSGRTFFKGLGRPWMGLHAVDTVRRDAAEQKIWFETISGAENDHVEIVLNCEQVILTYAINLKNDVIEKITFSEGDSSNGELRFSYLQDIDDTGGEFVQPKTGVSQSLRVNSDGILWLVRLVNGW